MVGIRQFDEERVLGEALELFWRQGLAATSMPDLAEHTKVQRGSLYNAYGDKNTLFLKAFDVYAQHFLQAAKAGLSASSAAGALSGFFRSAVANMTAGSPPRGCLTTKTATDGSLSSPKIAERLQRLLDDLEALIMDGLGKFAGELVLTPAETARVAVTFTRGLAVMERIYGDPARLMASANALVRSLTAGRPAAPSNRRATPSKRASKRSRRKTAVGSGGPSRPSRR